MSVTEKLRATYFNEFGGRVPTTTEPKALPILPEPEVAHFGGWEGLVSLLTTGITGYTAVQEAQEQRRTAETVAEIERLKLAQAVAETPQAKVSDFLRRYWPWLFGGTGALITLALVFRKKS